MDHQTLQEGKSSQRFCSSFMFGGMKYDAQHKKTLDTIISLIRDKYPETLGIYLFGSYGSLYGNQNSDIDIAILHKQPIDTVELWNHTQKIACQVRRDVDLIDLRNEVISSTVSESMQSMVRFRNIAYSVWVLQDRFALALQNN